MKRTVPPKGKPRRKSEWRPGQPKPSEPKPAAKEGGAKRGPRKPPRPRAAGAAKGTAKGTAKATAPEATGPTAYRLLVEYDGTGFSGWQEQANAKSVQGAIRAAFLDAGVEIRELMGAGRTDAGVHALAQVAHLRLDREIDVPRVLAVVNDSLPGGVHLLAIEPVPIRFHARHDAVARTYTYQLARRRTAFAKRFVWWVKEPLDLGRMRKGAALFAGRHDFRLFCQAPGTQASTLVEVESVEVAEAGDLVLVRVTASHFLWRMVRRVVGTLVQLGLGTIEQAHVESLLAGKPIPEKLGDPGRWTAPASGLFLERVRYAGDPPPGPLTSVTPIPAVPGQSRRKR